MSHGEICQSYVRERSASSSQGPTYSRDHFKSCGEACRIKRVIVTCRTIIMSATRPSSCLVLRESSGTGLGYYYSPLGQ